jgi:plasmid stabilization system protein ParE
MKRQLAVVLRRRATREVERIHAWWQRNRPAAQSLFIDELEQTLAAVSLSPSLGAPARSDRVRGVRRVLLRRTSYYLYYRVRGETLEVLALWHAARGRGPTV